jgi:hypothetical protein
MKKIIDPIKISEAAISLISSLTNASERMCNTASAIRAPKARLNRNLMTVLKMLSVQQRWERTKMMAERKPIREMPRPVRMPKPQT